MAFSASNPVNADSQLGPYRIIDLLDHQSDIREPARPRSLRSARGRLVFDGVSFSYPGVTRAALNGITFAVAPGQTVALVGASGAGKTTVANLLVRFLDPDEGRVTLAGRDLRPGPQLRA